MSKVKLVIEIEHNEYTGIKNFPDGTTSYPWTLHLYDAVRNGTPLDDVKAEIEDLDRFYDNDYFSGNRDSMFKCNEVMQILDNIGKADKRSEIRCNTCKNNDDELSGECYECIKGIFDHYEPEDIKTEVKHGRTND